MGGGGGGGEVERRVKIWRPEYELDPRVLGQLPGGVVLPGELS